MVNLDVKVKCSQCGWEGTHAQCRFGHDDFYCPVCRVESLVSRKETITKLNPIGQPEIVPQKDIDFWCDLCQFPTFATTGQTKCTESRQIQRCWDADNAIAGEWHKRHECPFIHQGQKCRCNDYASIQKAFEAVGLPS